MKERTLNEIMEFDHVICVLPGGTIVDSVPGVHAPEVHVETDEDGQILDEHEKEMIEQAKRDGWHLLTGHTGQYGYAGAIMHRSEFVGGGLENYIRENPGLYCVVAVEDGSEEAAGWAIAYRCLCE